MAQRVSAGDPRFLVVVDRHRQKNKPRALNSALPFCRGEIVGVFDAVGVALLLSLLVLQRPNGYLPAMYVSAVLPFAALTAAGAAAWAYRSARSPDLRPGRSVADAPPRSFLLVDDTFWTDLVDRGFSHRRVVWPSK
ncbi:MAG TPA: hypothetical protein VK576_02615, partial [Thermoleophilia bacterium]|nr:hypothetical protein [Thermoleophilia bacterium]